MWARRMAKDQAQDTAQTLTYIQDMLGQLKMMAQSSKQELLSYMIGIAIYETDRALKEQSGKAGREIAKDSLYLPERVD